MGIDRTALPRRRGSDDAFRLAPHVKSNWLDILGLHSSCRNMIRTQ